MTRTNVFVLFLSFAGLAGGVWVWFLSLPRRYFSHYDWDVCTGGASTIYDMKADHALFEAGQNFGIRKRTPILATRQVHSQLIILNCHKAHLF